MTEGLFTIFFGGTFDPVHLGHLAVIRELRRRTELPVLAVPAGVSSHRRPPQASALARAEMLELAVQTLSDPLVRVSRHEVEQSQPSFTVDSVEWLRRRRPGLEVVLALGADAATGIPDWKEASRLLTQVRLTVFGRAGVMTSAEEVLAELGRRGLPLAGAQVLTISAPAIHATDIRNRIRRSESWAGLVPRGVGDYIRSRRLYAWGPGPASSVGEG